MAYTYPVKFINNAMRGAPQVSGTAGTLIAALDAFLLTGWAPTAAISVSVTGGVGTAEFNDGSFFEDTAIVLIDGATSPALLNGEARVLSHTNKQIKFETNAPDGIATGAITFKYAPVGNWEKTFSGTNKAAYRSTDIKASGFFLRVDDTGTVSARVRGFEVMTDVDTGTGPFPTDTQISGGGHWIKSTAANTTAVRYDIFADSRALFVALAPGVVTNPSFTGAPARGFGDMIPLRAAGDVYSVALACNAGTTTGSGVFSNGAFDFAASVNDAIFVPRAIAGLGSAQVTASVPYVGNNSSRSGGDATLGAFPSVVDGELKYSKRYIHSGDGSTPRAEVPGLLHVPQSGVSSLVSPRDTFQGTGALTNRTLVAIGVTGAGAGSAPSGI